MYTSIDQALDKAERQLRKLREKVQDHHPAGTQEK
jgi:ribosomal subunit interface protein